MFGKNWKTSAGGIGAILSGLAGIIHCFTAGHGADAMTMNHAIDAAATATSNAADFIPCLTASAGSIMAGIGLLKAKDHNVTGGTVSQ